MNSAPESLPALVSVARRHARGWRAESARSQLLRSAPVGISERTPTDTPFWL
jgi:hypothetical protein